MTRTDDPAFPHSHGDRRPLILYTSLRCPAARRRAFQRARDFRQTSMVFRKGHPMATPTTLPRPRAGLSGRWLAGGIALIVVAILAALLLGGAIKRPAATSAAPATVAVTRGSLTATVPGSGSVAAEQNLSLGFQGTGTVTEVLVKEGDSVQAGQVLARLDDRQFVLQVTNAQAGLQSARARLSQAQQGNDRPEDLASAQAAVASAQANFDKVSKGPTASDLAAVQAALSSAQAAYQAAVNSGGTTGSQM